MDPELLILILFLIVASQALVTVLAWLRVRRAKWDPLLGGSVVLRPPPQPQADLSRCAVSAVPLRHRPRRTQPLLTTLAAEEYLEPALEATPQRPASFFPEYLIDPDGTAVLDRVIEVGADLRSGLIGEPVELEVPLRPRHDEAGRLVDADMPELDERFVEGEGAYAWERTLDQGRELDGGQRLALAIGIARFLNELHQQQWAFGALNWSNMLLAAGPEPVVLIRGIEQARPLGGRQAVRCTIHPLWMTRADEPLPTLDLDRYQFALLLYRLMVSRSTGAMLPVHTRLSGYGFPQEQAARLEPLFDRAAGPVGTRPAISEWLAALG